MNDVVEVLKKYIQTIDTTKSPQIIVANIRSFVQLLKSPSIQPVITTLKEQKYDDLKEFQKAFISFQGDKKKVFCSIEEFVKRTPFLQKHLSDELFAQNIPDNFVFFEPFAYSILSDQSFHSYRSLCDVIPMTLQLPFRCLSDGKFASSPG